MLLCRPCAGRKRWVVYGNSFNYSPTSVPAEWHGWLNYINDYNPKNHDFKQPAYAVEHYQTRTGSALSYQPKGSWAHGDAKRWAVTNCGVVLHMPVAAGQWLAWCGRSVPAALGGPPHFSLGTSRDKLHIQRCSRAHTPHARAHVCSSNAVELREECARAAL